MKIKNLNQKDFKKYGVIIELSKGKISFHVLFSEKENVGWRIGYSRLLRKPVTQLEAHPDSYETFEPVSGTSVILLSADKKPKKIEAFLLDKPICLKKNIWHEVISLSEFSEIKIFENYNITGTKYFKLKKPLDIWIK